MVKNKRVAYMYELCHFHGPLQCMLTEGPSVSLDNCDTSWVFGYPKNETTPFGFQKPDPPPPGACASEAMINPGCARDIKLEGKRRASSAVSLLLAITLNDTLFVSRKPTTIRAQNLVCIRAQCQVYFGDQL